MSGTILITITIVMFEILFEMISIMSSKTVMNTDFGYNVIKIIMVEILDFLSLNF